MAKSNTASALVNKPVRPHVGDMKSFEFTGPAELFAHAGRSLIRGPMTYKRFPTGAGALRYAVEVLSESNFRGAIVETELGRFNASEILTLYNSPGYPLPRPRTS